MSKVSDLIKVGANLKWEAQSSGYMTVLSISRGYVIIKQVDESKNNPVEMACGIINNDSGFILLNTKYNEVWNGYIEEGTGKIAGNVEGICTFTITKA